MSLLNQMREAWATLTKPTLLRDAETLAEEAAREAHGLSMREAAVTFHEWLRQESPKLAEAFTQADIELALDDRGWLVGGKRMAGELDPLSRQVQVNRSRYYWLRDPLVKQAVRLYNDYSLGDEAISYECDDESVIAKVDAFMKARKNRRVTSRIGQRLLSTRLLVDGDVFFGMFTDGTVRRFDPLQITDIITDPDDDEIVVAYKRTIVGRGNINQEVKYYKPWDYDGDAPPPQAYGELQPYYGGSPTVVDKITWEDDVTMYHLPLDPFDKRGNTLVSACSDWSREHRRFMIARVALTEALSRFAYNLQVKGGQKAADAIRSKLESTFAQTGLSGGVEHQPPNAPGGSFISNEGVKIEAMPRATGASDAMSDARNLKLQVCAGTGIMEHYFGDPSTGNLATATAMELPMLKQFKGYQQLWKDAWRDLFSIVLEENPDGTDRANIKLIMPDIIEEDLGQLAQAITAITTVFPEAKVPSVLRRCLTTLSIENLDEVMEEIAQQKETMDANVAAGKNPDGSEKPDLLKVKQGLVKNPDAAQPVSPDASESIAESLRQLVELLK